MILKHLCKPAQLKFSFALFWGSNMESKIRPEYSLYVTWTSRALLHCLYIYTHTCRSMSFLKTLKKMQTMVIFKVCLCKILQCSKSSAEAIISVLQVKLFSRMVFPIFEPVLRVTGSLSVKTPDTFPSRAFQCQHAGPIQ